MNRLSLHVIEVWGCWDPIELLYLIAPPVRAQHYSTARLPCNLQTVNAKACVSAPS